MKLKIKVDGKDGLLKRFLELADAVRPAVARALAEEARALFEASQALVPVDQGPLKASGQIGLPQWTEDHAEAEVSYGSAAIRYAWSVHENPRSGKTGGISPSGRRYKTWAKTGTWKFLEQPATERAKDFESRLTAEVTNALAR
jgi:hypothetical protein